MKFGKAFHVIERQVLNDILRVAKQFDCLHGPTVVRALRVRKEYARTAGSSFQNCGKTRFA